MEQEIFYQQWFTGTDLTILSLKCIDFSSLINSKNEILGPKILIFPDMQ